MKVDALGDGGPMDAGYPDAPGEPPPPPDGGTATSNVYTFAINAVLLGETAR